MATVHHVCYKDDIKFYQPYLSIVDFLFHNAPSRLADYLHLWVLGFELVYFYPPTFTAKH